MKIIFLDFDGVMDTEYYDHILSEAGKPISDEYGSENVLQSVIMLSLMI